jgi:hypothetical protein
MSEEDESVTNDAAQRAAKFLQDEINQLPKGHPWRRQYTRELLALEARLVGAGHYTP